ncbi:MAG: hypothetical protein ACYDEV_00990 [Acidiferrobacter sp.]
MSAAAMPSTHSSPPAKGTKGLLTRDLPAGFVTLMALLFSCGSAQARVAHWTGCQAIPTALCQSFLKRLEASHCVTKACAVKILSTDPRFRNPPWKVLNARHHKKLIVRLFRYEEGFYGYHKQLLPRPNAKAQAQARAKARAQARQFLAEGGTLRLWRRRLIPAFYPTNVTAPAVLKPAPPGRQTVIDLHTPSHPGHAGHDQLFLVTSGLTGPDPAVDFITASELAHARIRLLQGKPYLVEPTAAVYDPSPRWRLASVGHFRLVPAPASGLWKKQNFVFHPHGAMAQLAQALLHRLNQYHWTNDECAFDVLYTYPKFTSPPWRKLNPQHHIRLIAKLLEYWYPPTVPLISPAKAWLLWLWKAHLFIAQGGQLRVWRARVIGQLALGDPTPPGQQTLVELRWPRSRQKVRRVCPDKPFVPRDYAVFFAAPNLKGLDPRFAKFYHDSNMSDGTIRLFRGKAYFVVHHPYRVITGDSSFAMFHFVPGGRKS